ncbi:putative serine/threonine-protein kinase 38-like [Capsicum annuum]|nr:putative serine/threonine-protein kinase 38-like [Capsicum annuum]
MKQAVSKFGEIVDWKSHRQLTVEDAEDAKFLVLKEVDSTKILIEELKLNLERAQTEEQQERHDSKLAKLKVEDMEWGIADDVSIAAKAQLEIVKNLAVEPITSKEFLEAAHAAHLKAKDHRVGESMEREKDIINWEQELKKAEEELERLNQKILSAKDHRAKLYAGSSLLQDINNELATYMESKLKQEADEEENSKGELLEPKK